MELRVLKYFLVVAREENITRAAALLHVTQPTLSRQLMQLEEELGVKLFRRGRYHITLTDDGVLLRRRAQEIVDLAEKTEREFQNRGEELAGEIAIGCGETGNMSFLSERMAEFRKKHPLVRFQIHSAGADDIKERMEKGLADMGLLIEPVDIGRYEFIRMQKKEQWGVMIQSTSPLAEKPFVTPEDLRQTPLIMAKRELVQNELANWFGDVYESLEIAATYNLLLNAVNMVRHGVGAALCFRLDGEYSGLSFLPLEPKLEAGAVLAWKKAQTVSTATGEFIRYVKEYTRSISENAG